MDPSISQTESRVESSRARFSFGSMLCTLQAFMIALWTCPFIPSIGLRTLLEGQVPFHSLQQVRWRYWIIMGGIGLVAVTQCHDLAIQRVFNYFRTICKCDVIRIFRMSDTVEGAVLWLRSNNPNELRDYYMCRSVCP